MAFPTSNVSIANLNSASDDPSLARADLLDAVQKLNTIIDEADTAQGVVTLDSTGFIRTSQIPNTIAVTGTQTLSPSDGIVNIQSRLRLSQVTNAFISNIASPIVGDMAFCSNITSYANITGNTEPGIVFYTGAGSGSGWHAFVFSSMYELP